MGMGMDETNIYHKFTAIIIVCFLLQARGPAETIVHSADNIEVKSQKLLFTLKEILFVRSFVFNF
jgi:hypothetical protein